MYKFQQKYAVEVEGSTTGKSSHQTMSILSDFRW
jgi:hypothetical protein